MQSLPDSQLKNVWQRCYNKVANRIAAAEAAEADGSTKKNSPPRNEQTNEKKHRKIGLSQLCHSNGFQLFLWISFSFICILAFDGNHCNARIYWPLPKHHHHRHHHRHRCRANEFIHSVTFKFIYFHKCFLLLLYAFCHFIAISV